MSYSELDPFSLKLVKFHYNFDGDVCIKVVLGVIVKTRSSLVGATIAEP